jgi:hypothetical protein
MNEKEIFEKFVVLTKVYGILTKEYCSDPNIKQSVDYFAGYFNFLKQVIQEFNKYGIENISKKIFSNWHLIVYKERTFKEFKEITEKCLSYIHNLDINPPNRKELSNEYLRGNAAAWYKFSSELKLAESKINEI